MVHKESVPQAINCCPPQDRQPNQSMEELFAAELASRQAAEANQAEVAAAAVFDGAALLALLR